jgi:diguanylate cyclase (GGDEF)-like protein
MRSSALPCSGLDYRESPVEVLGVRSIGVAGSGLNDARSRPLRGLRQGGVGLLVMGTAGFSAVFIPGAVAHGRGQVLVMDVAVMLAGVIVLSRWGRRLTGYRSLVLPLFSLGLVAFANAEGLFSPITLGIYFVVIFVWIGQWHRPGTPLRFAPVGVAAYLLPFAAGAPRSSGEVSSVVLVMTASVLIAEVLARQATAAHLAQQEQAEALATLARASRTDDLTGLGNRRLGNQLLDRLAVGDSVAILDLDHFKRVNDTHGHARGDLLLQELGAFLRAEVRDADTVARMGGEEFLVVLRASAGSGVPVVERLLLAWQGREPLATLSAGVAVHRHGQSPSVTYAQADGALYDAKAAGRGQLMLALAEAALP